MQANNKNDATQVYEGATRATKTGARDTFKYILKPLTLFTYHYFVEGIKAVQNDGPTKELEKITNLSYDETIKIMEKCQKDGVRVVATERNLSTKNEEFGKKKSLYQQKKITKYSRRIKKLSNFKANYPKLAKLLYINKAIAFNKVKQKEQIEGHKDKFYNIYFNKSKMSYMNERIEDLIEYRTGISHSLFDENTYKAIENDSSTYNAQQLKELSEKFKLHDIGNIDIEEFKHDYCIHTLPFSAYLKMKDELEVADIPYGVETINNDEDKNFVNIYFQYKDLERYNEYEFNQIGKIVVYGNENKNFDNYSKDEVITFTTETESQEKTTLDKLSGKNYIMERNKDKCVWTALKQDLKELVETEKKRDVVNEDLENLQIFEQLNKSQDNMPEITENEQNISLEFDIEKEAGD